MWLPTLLPKPPQARIQLHVLDNIQNESSRIFYYVVITASFTNSDGSKKTKRKTRQSFFLHIHALLLSLVCALAHQRRLMRQYIEQRIPDLPIVADLCESLRQPPTIFLFPPPPFRRVFFPQRVHMQQHNARLIPLHCPMRVL